MKNENVIEVIESGLNSDAGLKVFFVEQQTKVLENLHLWKDDIDSIGEFVEALEENTDSLEASRARQVDCIVWDKESHQTAILRNAEEPSLLGKLTKFIGNWT
jgi:hypothetical protein